MDARVVRVVNRGKRIASCVRKLGRGYHPSPHLFLCSVPLYLLTFFCVLYPGIYLGNGPLRFCRRGGGSVTRQSMNPGDEAMLACFFRTSRISEKTHVGAILG
jgi:hypothetical protein